MERQKVNVMKKKFVSILLTVFMILLFVGCDLDGLDSHNNNETFEVTDINELDQIEYFRSGALEHILEGELNKNGQAVGYHYDQLPTKKGEIIEGTETKPNEVGIYEAEVIVTDVKKTDRKSTRLNSSHVATSYAVFCLKKKIRRKGHRIVRKRSHTAPTG